MLDENGNEIVTPAKPATPATPEPQNFSVEYVRELRGEAKGYRLKLTEMETTAKAAAEAAAKAVEAAELKATTAAKSAEDRVIRAELKAVALAKGLVDLDGLKLADLSKVKLNEAGEVTGADEMLEALKATKAYLFKAVGASSSNPGAQAPKPGDQKPKKAHEMTADEYAAAKKALTNRR